MQIVPLLSKHDSSECSDQESKRQVHKMPLGLAAFLLFLADMSKNWKICMSFYG